MLGSSSRLFSQQLSAQRCTLYDVCRTCENFVLDHCLQRCTTFIWIVIIQNKSPRFSQVAVTETFLAFVHMSLHTFVIHFSIQFSHIFTHSLHKAWRPMWAQRLLLLHTGPTCTMFGSVCPRMCCWANCKSMASRVMAKICGKSSCLAVMHAPFLFVQLLQVLCTWCSYLLAMVAVAWGHIIMIGIESRSSMSGSSPLGRVSSLFATMKLKLLEFTFE